MNIPWISLLTFLPLLGGFVLIGSDSAKPDRARRFALGISLASAALALTIAARFDGTLESLQFVERYAWIPTMNAEYFVGLDGIGLLMVVLSALVVPVAILTSWNVAARPHLYFALVLLLESGLFGAFTALSFFHWFLFWELSLIPAFFLIKLWGGAGRGPASTQFFVYTMAGSVALLVAFAAIMLATGSSDFIKLAEAARTGALRTAIDQLNWAGLSGNQIAMLLCGGILFGFAVKVPLMPFHSWLPATYTEAPTGTTILLTGAMSKMGMYGFLRILLPLFPGQLNQMMTPLLLLAVATIVCSAAAAFAQKDLKRIFAYSSINHLGYCLLGTFAVAGSTGNEASPIEKAAALNGVVLQMFNHGLTATALFCFIGFIERRTGGARSIDGFGGLRKVAPVFCGLMGITLFASLGLPGLNGFVGEFLIFKGSFPLAGWAVAWSSLGLLISAVFLLTILQRVFHGPLNPQWTGFSDLGWGERWVVIPGTILMFLFGLWPQLLIGVLNPTVTRLVAAIGP